MSSLPVRCSHPGGCVCELGEELFLPCKRVLGPALLPSREPGQEAGQRAVQEDAAGERSSRTAPCAAGPGWHPLCPGRQVGGRAGLRQQNLT